MEIYVSDREYRMGAGSRVRRTVFKRQRANNIPADPANVDPPNLHPMLSLAGRGIIEVGNKLTVGHPPKTAPNARVIRDLDHTALPDVSVVQIRRVLADVYTRFCTCPFPGEVAGGFGEVHHLSGRRAKTLDGSQRRLGVGDVVWRNGSQGLFRLE